MKAGFGFGGGQKQGGSHFSFGGDEGDFSGFGKQK